MFLLHVENVNFLFEQAYILEDDIMLQNKGTREFKNFASTRKQTKQLLLVPFCQLLNCCVCVFDTRYKKIAYFLKKIWIVQSLSYITT